MADTNGATRFYPLGFYNGLDVGPTLMRAGTQAESHAVDGTKKILRDSQIGSPFTFRVTPPTVLLDALLGNGQARTRDFFDPLLRQVFNEAEQRFQAVLSSFEAGTATEADVEAARQGMLGGRAPAAGQNIGIIEAATRSKNNFSALVSQRRQFQQSNFFATGPTRGATLTRLEDMIGSNGIRFNPRDVGQTEANQAAVSDLTQALDVIVQLNRMLVTPPLTLLVNPEQLTITYAKKQTFQDRNRFGYIFQSWGEEQVRLSVTGKSAGFVAGSKGESQTQQAFGQEQTRSVSGYQFASKWSSAAWQNLMGLFTFYRNNGYIYDTAGKPKSEAHPFIGNVEISYDQWVYVGNFESFQYQYEEEKQQGAVSFSFEFVASHVFDQSQGGAVRPISGPTPSPSSVSRQNTPSVPNQQAKTITTLPTPQDGEASTAVLDPLLDPFRPRSARPSRNTGSMPSNPFATQGT